MRRRIRKFIGATVMLGFVPIYMLIVTALAQTRPFQQAPKAVQLLCFAVLGLVWILPLMPLIRWMEKPDPEV